MPWVIGIDEAGYGPNLGPLVQAAVAVDLPADDAAGWATLKERVRRCHEPADHRVLVDDSKKVHALKDGVAKLAAAVQPLPPTLAAIVAELGLPSCLDELKAEHWFAEETPLDFKTDDVLPIAAKFVNVVHPPRFNAVVRQAGSKAAVTSQGVIALMQAMAATAPAEMPLHFVVDKQGGRNFYAPLLQEAFPAAWIVADREGAAESRYRITNLGRDITAVFRPRADGDSVSVALASMLAKYLRERCMAQFNAFWQRRVPGLAATAGYPVDAKRFLKDIEPALEAAGIGLDDVWRIK